jgi:uncharacterized membrane protein YdjX (TVP38/TMEM64 family)/rhodanese-related sulfurtransferase
MNRASILRACLVLAVGGGAAAGWAIVGDSFDAADFEAVIGQPGGLAPLIFVAAFALATVLFVPGSLFALAGGALFGPAWGTIWNLAGATLGATAAFLFARFVGGEWISARAGDRLKAALSGVEAEGWRFVALTRLAPIVPFNVLNYALGVTRIPLSHYVLASLISMAPGAAAFAWLGHAGRSAMAGDSAAIRHGMLGLAAVALIAFLPGLIRRFANRPAAWISAQDLQRRLSGDRRPVVVDVREPGEFSGPLGNIPGAVNIPLRDVALRSLELQRPDGSLVVLVCRTDKRSAKAAAILRGLGVTRVAVLRGGMEAWGREPKQSGHAVSPA